jgi:hypothetical protein
VRSRRRGPRVHRGGGAASVAPARAPRRPRPRRARRPRRRNAPRSPCARTPPVRRGTARGGAPARDPRDGSPRAPARDPRAAGRGALQAPIRPRARRRGRRRRPAPRGCRDRELRSSRPPRRACAHASRPRQSRLRLSAPAIELITVLLESTRAEERAQQPWRSSPEASRNRENLFCASRITCWNCCAFRPRISPRASPTVRGFAARPTHLPSTSSSSSARGGSVVIRRRAWRGGRIPAPASRASVARRR